ncbi:hypothetical protein EMQ25_17395 [Arsenicitalea aurantiaca]|uniref:Uncharacterized protein n=1 Tax=Arsenicitalea aurantiaca TaxID=1783274 RepID=A0A433X2R8_9HYPH|nr:hypothetical protein [Arsenicitalea aurantiaca]RUT28357.1 hypothetical protein EMQ25_17395 [Arsenicitalea aurantiaca]
MTRRNLFILIGMAVLVLLIVGAIFTTMNQQPGVPDGGNTGQESVGEAPAGPAVDDTLGTEIGGESLTPGTATDMAPTTETPTNETSPAP